MNHRWPSTRTIRGGLPRRAVRLREALLRVGLVLPMLVGAVPAWAVTAIDDGYVANEDASLTVPAPGVLDNDSLDGGDAPIVTGFTAASSGTVTVNPDGSFTYTPFGQFNGVDTFDYTANNTAGPSSATVTVTVNPVNDEPSFVGSGDVTVPEDSGAQVVGGWATGYAGAPNETGQTLTYSVSSDDPSLFAVVPAIDGVSGDLSFTPAADAVGSATITVEVMDSGGTANGGDDTSPSQTFTITLTGVNDAPAFTAGPDQTVAEDAGPQTVPGWASGMSRGPADEAGQSLTFTVVGNTNSALFSSQPEVDTTTGDLTFTPAADASGSATLQLELRDSGGTAGGGVDAVTQSFTIDVDPVNDEPSFTGGGDVTVAEDAPAQLLTGWATGFAGAADEAGQTFTYNVSIDNPALFAAGPVINAAGDLSFTPAANTTGSATVTVSVTDDGGMANGGVDTSPDQTFTITVTAVNDPPVFTTGPDQTVAEDAGPQSVSAWASGMSPGPADESGQSLTFTVVGNTNSALFSSQPEVNATTGDLTFTPAPDANGSATLQLELRDSGGTAGGGVDAVTQTFTITVDPVNDPPVLENPIADINTFEDAPNQTVDLSAVFTDVDIASNGDSLTFSATGNSNPGLFDDVSVAGAVLTLDLALDMNGLATLEVTASDSSGATATDTFVVNVSEVNDLPAPSDDAATMAEDGGFIDIPVMCNDYLGERPTNLTAAGSGGESESTPTTIVDRNGDEITAANGTVTIIEDAMSCNGTLTDVIRYEPKAHFHGEDFFSYAITDSNTDTGLGTVTVTVTPVNDPPEGLQQIDFDMFENQELVVNAATGMLAGSYDVDGAVLDEFGNPVGGETLTVSDVVYPLVGSLSLDAATGAFTYQPPVDFVGEVQFEYRISDGTATSGGDPYRVRVAVLDTPPAPEPPPAGEVATIFNLANAPLEQSTSVPPNVLVVMDDSGSMDWNLIVGEAGHDGTFVIDNGSVAFGRNRANTNYTYLWDLSNNAYPPTSGNGRILPTEEGLEDDSETVGSDYGVWRARSHLYNPLYYNPSIQYTPWVGQDAANQEFADADPANIRLNPRDPTDLMSILDGHSYRSSQVPEFNSGGGTTTVWVNDLYIPRYYATAALPPLAAGDTHDLVEICRAGTVLPNGDTCTGGPLPGNDFPGGPDRADCALDDGDPTDCTYAQEIQNFANWFQYYRSREYVTKNGMGKVISQLQDIRIGYMTISATTTEDIREMNALHTEGDKKTLLDNVYRVDSYGGTPLRQALGRAGDTFACDYGRMDCPILPAPEGFCQQNFTLLFSDGYWNGGTGTSGNRDGDEDSVFDGGRYADAYDATLADVAMHFYETDLHPALDDQVPVMRRDVDGRTVGSFPAVDATMHQHMKTYTIAFGVVGTVVPSDVPVTATTPFNWPDPFSGNQEKIDDMLHTAINGRGRFLNAGNPQDLQAAFESAFLEFTQAASSTSAAAFNSTSLQEDTLLYRGFYDLRDNTGELTATIVNDDGSLEPLPQWRAAEQLDLLPTPTSNNRVIVTFDPDTRQGVAFRHASLTAAQQLTLNANQVEYLRGDRTQETNNGGDLRERPVSNGLLGDIVNSSPVFVGQPRAINRDQRPYPTDDLYSDFADTGSSRSPIVYVGANDGMLHGFDGDSGREMFAYVPNKIIDSSQGYHNPLDSLTDPFYQHRYYVDLSPQVNDVYMRASRLSVGKSWNTVLMGGLGAGGKGFFALNVTDPGAFATHTSAARTALWEFTDEDDTYPVDALGNPLGGSYGAITDPTGAPVKDLGYSLSLPVVTMSNVGDGGSPEEKEWVAVFGNGPNSTAGIAKLFVVFMNEGLDGWQAGDFIKLDTGFGVQSPPHVLAGYPNGLGSPTAVDTDLNGTVDRVYAGDRLGNLFRFDLSDADPDNWTVTRLFTASYTDPDTGDVTVQPILARPTVIKHPTERGFLVIFGTGSYLTRDDVDSSDIQSIYAIWDEGSSNPFTAQTDTKELRLVEQTITNVTDATFTPPIVRRIVSNLAVDYQTESGVPGTYGWYIDLDMVRAPEDTTGGAPPDPQFPGEKAIRTLLYRDGTIITTTVLPALDEFSCFGTRPGSILVFDAVSGGDAQRPVVDFNTDGVIDSGDLVDYGGEQFAGGILFNQQDLDGQLVDLSTLGGQGDTDWLFVSGGNETISYRIADLNDNRTGRLSWRQLDTVN